MRRAHQSHYWSDRLALVNQGAGCRYSQTARATVRKSARGRLKEFDRVARRIVQYDLRTARPGYDIAPKRQSCFSQTLYLARQVVHDEMNTIPAPRSRAAAVRQGAACRTCRPA